MTNSRTTSDSLLSWVHFGDLHIRNAYDENPLDFFELIENVNEHLAGKVDFAFLPDNNADNGLEAQYKLVRGSPVDYENAIGAYPAKGILGTELGPDEKGTKGPWPSADNTPN